MTQDRIKKIEDLFKQQGPILRTSLLRKSGICTKDIIMLLDTGRIERVKKGYYALKADLNNLSDFEIAASVIPEGTVTLFSAASIYGLSTVIPSSVNIAAPSQGKPPLLPDYPPINLVRQKRPNFDLGRTIYHSASGTFPIYDRERTVCDFIKRRDDVGYDVALEVLKNYMKGKKDIQKLYKYADAMRIRNRINPYVEALL